MQGSKLYVGNLSYSVTSEQLQELFSTFGTVRDATVIGDKGFGFVEMSSQAEAEEAMEKLDGSDYKGRNLKVNEARPKRERPRRDYNRY